MIPSWYIYILGEPIMPKENLSNLLNKILNNEEYIRMFTFFYNKVENTQRTIEEIYEYVGTHNNNVNSEFIDIEKIELIANAVLNKTALKVILTIHDFQIKYKKNLLKDDMWGDSYRYILEQYKDGDKIEELISPYATWKQLCGSAAIVLTRNGDYIYGIRKSMN